MIKQIVILLFIVLFVGLFIYEYYEVIWKDVLMKAVVFRMKQVEAIRDAQFSKAIEAFNKRSV